MLHNRCALAEEAEKEDNEEEVVVAVVVVDDNEHDPRIAPLRLIPLEVPTLRDTATGECRMLPTRM